MGRAGRTRRRSGIGENPPHGAVIYYYLENSTEDEVTLEILDAHDEVVRSYSSTEEKEAEPETFFNEGRDEKVSTDAGMNRFAWDLRYPDAEVTEGAIIWGTKQGPRAVPGSYKVRMKVGEWTDTRAFEVKKDPRLATTQEDFQEQFDLAMKIRALVVDTHEAVTRIREIRRQIEDLAERHREEPETLVSLAYHESRFEHRALSTGWAFGLLQVLPITCRRWIKWGW